MKVAFITTLHHNIGDDFVREGITYLLNEIYGDIDVLNIHKHSPVTTVYGMEFFRDYRLSRLVDPVLRAINANDRIKDADVIIQSGAPVYWCHLGGPHCSENEWYDSLIRNRLLKLRKPIPFLNIAGGSCQRYHSDGGEIARCEKCKSYVAEFFDEANLTLLRDSLAKKMLNIAGRDADVLPCTSIFARDKFCYKPVDGEYIVVNFMENGGHYAFGQKIDADRWRKNFIILVSSLSKFGRVVASCHNVEEKKLVNSLCPDIDAYIVPNDYEAFMRFYSNARFGVVNRVHAGFMMASFGKPVAVIGNDSRSLMIENIGLKSYYVDDIDIHLIDKIIQSLIEIEDDYFYKVEELRSIAKIKYINKISSILK